MHTILIHSRDSIAASPPLGLAHQEQFKKYAKAWTHTLFDNTMDAAAAQHWLKRAVTKLAARQS